MIDTSYYSTKVETGPADINPNNVTRVTQSIGGREAYEDPLWWPVNRQQYAIRRRDSKPKYGDKTRNQANKSPSRILLLSVP
jgi:hypothetical protein